MNRWDDIIDHLIMWHDGPTVQTKVDQSSNNKGDNVQGEKEFWLVWNGGFNRSDTPKRKHFSEVEAHKEAERLARLNPDMGFYVLKGVSKTKMQTVIVENLTSDDATDIPY